MNSIVYKEFSVPGHVGHLSRGQGSRGQGSRGSWVTWSPGQLFNRLRGAWVIADDSLSALFIHGGIVDETVCATVAAMVV